MQVADFTRYYPLLLESDTLTLSSRFDLEGMVLHDSTLGAKHTLQPQAREVMSALRLGMQLKDIEQLARSLHVSPRQLDEMIGFLNFIGALTLTRSYLTLLNVLHMRIRGHMVHIRYGSWSWRSGSSLMDVAQGLLRATWPVLLSSPFVIALVYVSGVVEISQWGLLAILWFTTFLGSFYIHELAHIAVVREAGAQCDTFQRGMRFGILHKPLPLRMEIISSLAGPAAGIGYCTLVWAFGYVALDPAYGYMTGIVSLFHVCSLLPWYGDGKSLYTHITRLRTKT